MSRFMNNRIQVFSVVLAVMFLSACRVGKEYQRPELGLPAQFKADNTQSFADTSSIADIEWKNFFTDPTLQALIEKALQYNNDLQVAIRRIDIARQQVKQSKALPWPEVGVQATGSINRPSDNSLNGLSIKNFLGKSYVENYSIGVTASWEVDIWGKIRREKIFSCNFSPPVEA